MINYVHQSMKKIIILFLTSIFCFAKITLCQSIKIIGTVTSKLNGTALKNVSISIKNTKLATKTNDNGSYTITVTNQNNVLVFTSIGTKTIEVLVGNQSEINVALEDNITQLETTIVTALGLRADRDKFASSTSFIKGDIAARSGETGILNGLSAKAAGVAITRSGGDPGGGSYIQIRGQNTINGNAQPLFIVDGMPVSNASDNIGAARSNGIIQQSRINDINPEDIETVEVLKGASAAALWGSRAANGVIIITTKKGKNTNGKLNISFKSTVSVDEVNKTHPLQTRYGQGNNGLFVQGGRSSFGDLISSRQGGADTYITNPTAAGYQGFVTLADGSKMYAIPNGTAANVHGGKNSKDTYNHTKDAFRRGYFFDNTLQLSGGSNKTNFLVSMGNLFQQGVVIASSDYDRKTIKVNANTEFTHWLSATANIGYTKIASARVQEGDNADGILLSSLRTPADYNNAIYTGTYTDAAGQVYPKAHLSYRNPLGRELNTIYANPTWNTLNNQNTSNVDRIIGSLQFDAKPTSYITTTARLGIDNFTDYRLERFARNSANFPTGYLSKNWIAEKQFNADLFAVIKLPAVLKNFTPSAIIGFNYNSRRRESLSADISNFIIPTAPNTLSNALNANLRANNFNSLIRTYGSYAQVDVAAYDMVYFTFTGRAESASSFGSLTNNTFFFPSASAAWQFSKLKIFNNNDVFSFGKLRLAFGKVGIQPQQYLNFTNYSSAGYRDDFTNGLSGLSALYGGGFARSTTAGNEYLTPEIKTEFEAGLDLRFFKNNITLSITGYSNNTKDIILPISLPAATGFTTLNSNAASLKNNGIEVEMSATLLKKNNLRWSIGGNIAANRNTVTSLAGAKAYTLPDSFIQNASLLPNQPFGVFYSTDFLKNKEGAYLLDANGFPQPGIGLEIIGDPNPDWRAGLGSTISYKAFAINILFDKVAGNDFFNGTRGSLYSFGTHGDQGETAIAPTGGIKDVNGVLISAGTAFQGQIKDFGAGPVALNQAWYQGRGSASNTASYKQFVEDATATRLREITLTYNWKNVHIGKNVKLSNIDFSLTGRNLILWTNYTGTDPEVNVTGVGLARGQDWFTNPNTKSVLLSILMRY